MTHNHWSPIKRLIRHKTLKSMFKIYTTSGSIICTEDHFLLLSTKYCIPPKDLVVNEHQLLYTNEIEDISSRIYYQKENGMDSIHSTMVKFYLIKIWMINIADIYI